MVGSLHPATAAVADVQSAAAKPVRSPLAHAISIGVTLVRTWVEGRIVYPVVLRALLSCFKAK